MRLGMKAVALAMSFLLASCASIVSKSNWPVTVQSNPTGAKCIIEKKDGLQVHTGVTPFTVTLSAKKGFFSSEDFLLTCEKEGFQRTKVDMPSSLNGWYWGNIVFGGVIGILIVDPATGAMWKLEETQVVTLLRSLNKENPNKETLPVSQSSTPTVLKISQEQESPK